MPQFMGHEKGIHKLIGGSLVQDQQRAWIVQRARTVQPYVVLGDLLNGQRSSFRLSARKGVGLTGIVPGGNGRYVESLSGLSANLDRVHQALFQREVLCAPRRS